MGGVRPFLIFWWERLLFSGRRGKITVALKRHMIEYPPVAKLDIAADSDSEGRGFESLRADHKRGKRLYDACRVLFFCHIPARVSANKRTVTEPIGGRLCE